MLCFSPCLPLLFSSSIFFSFLFLFFFFSVFLTKFSTDGLAWRRATGEAAAADEGGAGAKTRDEEDLEGFIEVALSGLHLSMDLYDEGAQHGYISRLRVIIEQADILDRLQVSNINKLLTDYRSETEPRECDAPMFQVSFYEEEEEEEGEEGEGEGGEERKKEKK